MRNLFVVSILLLMSTAHSQSLAPGVWKARISFTVNGLPLPETKDEDCITASEAKDAKGTITKGLKKKGCTLDKWTVNKGQLDAALTCKSDELDAKGKITGRFSEKSYDLKGEAEGTYQKMIPSTATLKLKGEWVKACAS